MVQNIFENNKRIAQNTFFLYLRMLFGLGLSLYTARIVINALGVENYGIYNVVAGFVSMFSFLNATMSGCSSRFITFEIGKPNGNIQRVFTASFTMHCIIAVIFIIICETIGEWFLYNKLVIPTEKMFEAGILFQLSVFSMALNITQVPFTASIVAHEKMGVYAYFEIINILFRLINVYLLLYVDYNKLLMYGIFEFCTSIIMLILYRTYSIKKISHCRMRLKWDYPIIKPMLSFSLWDLYGNLSVMGRTQGVNMLLNIFFGVVINAATGIATRVQGIVMGFASNIQTAFRPQIIKYYANGDYDNSCKLIYKASFYTYTLLLILSLPIILETNYIFRIWLGVFPQYTVDFCRLTLIFNMVTNFGGIIMIGIHSSGKIRRSSLINGTLYLSVIPLTYISFKFNIFGPTFPYILNLIVCAICLLLNISYLQLYTNSIFNFKSYFTHVIVKCMYITLIGVFFPLLIYYKLNESFTRLVMIVLLDISIIPICLYTLLLTAKERKTINSYIKRKLK